MHLINREILSRSQEGRLTSLRQPMITLIVLGLLIGLSLPCQAENSGVGFVLLTSIMRGKIDHSKREALFSCASDLTTSRPEDPEWKSDLYVVYLSKSRKQFWTRVDEAASCIAENLEDVTTRHPCLSEALEEAMIQADEMAEDLHQSYLDLQSRNEMGDFQTEDMTYKLVIQSTDKNLSFIDPDAWDFSWLSTWNPFLEDKNSCPFRFEFRHGVRTANGSQKILQRYHLNIPLE